MNTEQSNFHWKSLSTCCLIVTIIFFMASCGGKKSNDSKTESSSVTSSSNNKDIPGARFRIGDTVVVTNKEVSYSSYTEKFKELGFKNPNNDHPCKSNAEGSVFGVSQHENDKGVFLYAVRASNGDEFLIQQVGLRRGGFLKKLNSEFLGLYEGTEKGYVMKDEFGQEITYNNKKMTIPSLGYRILIETDNTIKVQTTNTSDNSQERYVGQYFVTRDEADSLEIECDMSDPNDKRFSINRKIVLSKSDKSGSCSPSNKKEPYFKITKTQ
jgi:hypothetical protein